MVAEEVDVGKEKQSRDTNGHPIEDQESVEWHETECDLNIDPFYFIVCIVTFNKGVSKHSQF